MALVTRRRFQKTAAGQRGQALLEILPVITLLLIVTFGVIEFSHAIWEIEVINGLTREGSNLASRNTALPDAATAVINDGTVLNLATNGEVIVTAVQNQGGKLVITAQTSSAIPLNGTVYVTEVFNQYSPITPLGSYVNLTLPSTLYNAAYF
jgi:Flp pilus assembly protein TadG